jgi:hypothetical protein
MILSLVLIMFLIAFSVYVHAQAKAWGDWVLFRPMTQPISRYMMDWILRDGKNNGNPLKCGLWHYCEHIKLFTMLSLALAALFFGAYMVIAHQFTPSYLIGTVFIGWFLYWIHGRIFTLIFHVDLVQDWTFKFWLRDTFTF